MRAPKQESNFEKHPKGQAQLVLTRIIDLGTVYDERKKQDVHRIMLAYESEKRMTEGEYAGQPFLVIESFSFSMYLNSHLCARVEAIRGEKFKDQHAADEYDLTDLLAAQCFANIGHSDDGKWTNIISIMPKPSSLPDLKPQTLIVWDFEAPNRQAFELLSEKMQNRLKEAKEWSGIGKGTAQPEKSPQRTTQAVSRQDSGPAPSGMEDMSSFDDSIPF